MFVLGRRSVWGGKQVGLSFIRGPGFCDLSAQVERR
ncbi:hypothetical protein NXF25_012741 [Crotalus adamanteus]|uniref:Uncharacterized protein n=1 Tax=Crotalus adamanteus TaxID=8729 RepID=A0AAW1BD73_CROAD